ncbi:MAG: phosphoglycerate kinase [Candidatus Zixiibacteriota bacterium]
MNKSTISSVNFKGKKTPVRVDFNVPLDSARHITDDRRIGESLPTVSHIIDNGGPDRYKVNEGMTA